MTIEPATMLDQIASLGAAGVMGAMWLWERRSNARREQQLDEAHARIMADAVKIEALVELVQQNTVALTRWDATMRESHARGAGGED